MMGFRKMEEGTTMTIKDNGGGDMSSFTYVGAQTRQRDAMARIKVIGVGGGAAMQLTT
jgi:hypothetical protein